MSRASHSSSKSCEGIEQQRSVHGIAYKNHVGPRAADKSWSRPPCLPAFFKWISWAIREHRACWRDPVPRDFLKLRCKCTKTRAPSKRYAAAQESQPWPQKHFPNQITSQSQYMSSMCWSHLQCCCLPTQSFFNTQSIIKGGNALIKEVML